MVPDVSWELRLKSTILAATLQFDLSQPRFGGAGFLLREYPTSLPVIFLGKSLNRKNRLQIKNYNSMSIII